MTFPDSEMHGRWQMVRAEFGGESVPELVATKTSLELSPGRYAIAFDGEVMDAGQFRPGDASVHRSLVFTCLKGANAGRTVRAIYQLVGNRLRICFSFDGKTPGPSPRSPRRVFISRRTAGKKSPETSDN